MRSLPVLIVVILAGRLPAAEPVKAAPVQFNRDIRPLLSDACFSCHGPDKAKRKSGLRFDSEEGARVDLGGHFAVVPGKPDQSIVLERVLAKDPAKRMPPPSAGPALKPEQVE